MDEVKTVYILIAGTGEYSDRTTWPVRVYTDKAKAEEMLKKLHDLNMGYEANGDTPYYKRKGIDPIPKEQVKAGYAEMGFPDISVDVDWELAEAPMDEHAP